MGMIERKNAMRLVQNQLTKTTSTQTSLGYLQKRKYPDKQVMAKVKSGPPDRINKRARTFVSLTEYCVHPSLPFAQDNSNLKRRPKFTTLPPFLPTLRTTTCLLRKKAGTAWPISCIKVTKGRKTHMPIQAKNKNGMPCQLK